MSRRRHVGEPITHLDGIPDGLTARQVHTLVTDDGDNERIQNDRYGRPSVTEVALRAEPAGDPHAPAADFGHRAVRTALEIPGRRRSSKTGVAPEQLGLALARAGLVELRADVRSTRGAMSVQPWRHWRRTERGEAHLAGEYGPAAGPPNPLQRYACEQADASHEPGWASRFRAAYEHVTAAIAAARHLTETGTSDGWPLSRFAREVTRDTHGLDRGEPLARLVAAALVPDGDADGDEGWQQAWADAGLAVDVLRSTVTCSGVPAVPTGGAAASLLASAVQDRLPVTISRLRLVHDPAPVGPPPAGHPGWMFAVENEALLSWAWRNTPDTPVVWYGSDAATRLLTAAEHAGWCIAVSADYEQGGLVRAAALLTRLQHAVAWQLDTATYLAHLAEGTGAQLSTRKVTTSWDPQLAEALAKHRVRLTEEDRFETLAWDLRAGRPGPAVTPG